MAHAGRFRLEQGERRILVVRRHWWLLVRPALVLLPLLVALPAYATADYLMPQADLAIYSSIFISVDLALCLVLVLKWLLADFVTWYADSYTLTNRRVIEQRGVVTVERREAGLRSVEESNYTISGAEARVFDYGDLRIQTGGRGAPIVFRQVPHPRRLQALVSAQVRAARAEHSRQQGAQNEINAALTRIFSGTADSHDAPTQAVPLITALTIRARRRLSLLPDEAVLQATRRHPAVLIAGAVAPCALIGACAGAISVYGPVLPLSAVMLLFGFLVLWVVWAVLDWRDDLYVLTSDRIIELRRTPLFFELRNVIQLRAVQDVVLRIASPADRLFNLGTLTVQLGGDAPLHLAAVPHPDRFQRSIFEAIDAALQRDRLREQERLAGTLTEWFKEYHRMQSQP
jgi:uncharacterized membrane protein YdbT with pleckstrin-like domain